MEARLSPYPFSVVELVARRRVAPHTAAQCPFPRSCSQRLCSAALAAGLSQRDNRHQTSSTRSALVHFIVPTRVVELVARRRVAPRPAAQCFLPSSHGSHPFRRSRERGCRGATTATIK